VIIFELSCDQEHRFEGWFRSAEDFDAQQDRGLLSCPHCDSHQIRKVPSGLHVAHGSAPAAPQTAPAAQTPTATSSSPAFPMAAYRQVVDFLNSVSEDVGTSFAEEARKMHYHEAPARAIRGQASADDYAALEDEGIDVFRLPTLGKDDLN